MNAITATADSYVYAHEIDSCLNYLEIISALHSTLDLADVLRLFGQHLGRAIPYHGYHYTYERDNIVISHGIQAKYAYQYALQLEKDLLGDMRIMRQQRFATHELIKLEEYLVILLSPLRNALLYQQAIRCALTDPLTGVRNRVALNDALSREWQQARRYNTPLSLLMIDIDHFKSINDRYGHLTGDNTLCQVGGMLRGAVRMSDCVFRYGGEEFILLLSNTHAMGAIRLAERIRRKFHLLRIDNLPHDYDLTASIGVATLQSGESAEQLLSRADYAMYYAKRNGRNRVICAEALPPASEQTENTIVWLPGFTANPVACFATP